MNENENAAMSLLTWVWVGGSLLGLAWIWLNSGEGDLAVHLIAAGVMWAIWLTIWSGVLAVVALLLGMVGFVVSPLFRRR